MCPGPLNAITDVPGVVVGHVTLVRGEGALVPGKGPVRTGVTAILPHRDNVFEYKVPAAVFVINGFGKATGLAQIMELGLIETPIVLTNTLSVGTAWDALCGYMLEENPDIGVGTGTVNPVVLECNDGFLNDIRGRHVKPEHVLEALRSASGGPVPEGNVGAGTGMSCLGFKGGIGTASRVLEGGLEGRTLGVLVLANFGSKEDLTIAGVPVGREISTGVRGNAPAGSVIVILATDAPLSSRQLARVAKRCTAGLARVGSTFSNSSGDFVVAFSTAYRIPHRQHGFVTVSVVRDDSPEFACLFRAASEATEEAVLNALFRAETMVGRDGNVREAIPVAEVLDVLEKYGRKNPSSHA
ncbi:MAG TPA: P1 family peptidase [Firmicutes bacterium]|nr:P1 family peptidase [Candidatus Fermentithermobacillaceae bacterium]